LVGGGDDGTIAKTPLGKFGLGVRLLLGHLGRAGLRPRRKRERGRGPSPGREIERVSPYFFLLSLFLIFVSLFKIPFQICFEFCLNSNFAERILNTHGLIE
jgi:hypothetical protein